VSASVSLNVSMKSTIWTSDAFIDGAVKLPVRETATELARCATGESVRRVRDIAQRSYDSSNDQPTYLHDDYLVGEVNLGSEC
jgi:hypothetical protein